MRFAATRAALRLVHAGVLASLFVAPAVAKDTKPYAPIPVEIGLAVAPPNDLLIAAKVLRDAAEAGNGEAVYSMIADEVTMISAGITVNVGRTVEKKGPFVDAEAAAEAIGPAFQEGDLPSPGGKVDLGAVHLQRALDVIVQAIDGADWGRDPLVKGGFCTYRGARWDAKAGEKAGGSGSRAYWVGAPTKVFKSADPGAAVAATLKPGFLYLQGFMDGLPEGWLPVHLPGGGVGAVPEAALKNPVPWGICFLPSVEGGWLISAFSSALL